MSYEVPAASQTAPSSPGRKPGTILMGVGVVAFFVGIASIAAVFLIPALGGGKPDFALYRLSMLCPLGLVLAVIAALVSGRRVRE